MEKDLCAEVAGLYAEADMYLSIWNTSEKTSVAVYESVSWLDREVQVFYT